MQRRTFLAAATGLAASSLLVSASRAQSLQGIRAVAFDGFPIIDPRPVAARAEALFPGRGGELMAAWRSRQFEYTWLRTLSGRYADFWRVTEDALTFAAKSLQIDLPAEKRTDLMQVFLQLKAWPDAAPALHALKAAGIRVAFLSNFTSAMLDAAVANSGLAALFEPHLSTDRVRAYKPDPRAYQMGLDAFGLPREQIVFVASAGWDAAGAKAFGYPTFWVNRAKLPGEELGVVPDAIGAGMADLAAFVGA
jgi:2-haloacid dehalogenase